jgi:hypothetical protein
VGSLKIEVLIEQKDPRLPAFAVVPAAELAPWDLAGTTTVEGTLDGVPLGRRSLKRWDDERWFIELKREHLAAAGKSPGDRATLVIDLASTALPDELQGLIDAVPEARAAWEALTEAQQRMVREGVQVPKTAAARERRARRALLPPAAPKAAPVDGLTEEAQALVVRVIGRRLPGRSCGPYTDVAVGLVRKVGCDPDEMIPADAREARFETRIEVRALAGAPDFRGPAVNGPPRERFLYLTWIGREAGAAPAMFRRAKLRLDAIPADVLARALKTGLLIGRLALTAADGMPVCASVRPPVIAWTSA